MMLVGLYIALVGIGLAVARPSVNGSVSRPFLENLLTSNKCFGDLGCYSTDDFYDPKHRPVNVVPADRESINTRFALYTRKNKPGTNPKPQFIQAFDRDSVRNSHFNPSHPVKFLIHGYLDTGFLKWVNSMGNALLDTEDMNVIAVDWSGGNGLPYIQATANTWVVGGEVAMLVKFLVEEFNLSLDLVHILGHSLGSHVAGYAGTRLGGKVARITGLDPAEPFFQYMPEHVRLDPADAQFVDVIHSDSKSIFQLGLGMVQPVGHLDFYPNGGQDQPGCNLANEVSNIIIDGLQETARKVVACNHMRAIYLYTDSVLSGCSFLAHECESYDAFLRGECVDCGKDGSKCATLGHRSFTSHPAPTSAVNRKLYLTTADKAPYCVRHYVVRVSLADRKEQKDEKGTLFVSLRGETGSVDKHQLNAKTLDLSRGKSYAFVVTSSKPLGRVTSVEFHWKNDWSILHPSSWLHKGHLWLSAIHVEPLDLQPEDRRLADATTLCPGTQHALDPKLNIKLDENGVCKP